MDEKFNDLPIKVTVVLGQATYPLSMITQLGEGSVMELTAKAGDPVSILINGKLKFSGEVIVINEKFGIRITDKIDNPQEYDLGIRNYIPVIDILKKRDSNDNSKND